MIGVIRVTCEECIDRNMKKKLIILADVIGNIGVIFEEYITDMTYEEQIGCFDDIGFGIMLN